MTRLIQTVFLGVVLYALPGCLVIGGHSSDTVLPTVGQQLIDLKKARDQGAISPEEYERLKQQLMEERPAQEPGKSTV